MFISICDAGQVLTWKTKPTFEPVSQDWIGDGFVASLGFTQPGNPRLIPLYRSELLPAAEFEVQDVTA